ncbi:LysM peptidoglycan-binding domain-containing protein [Kineococcus sp. DHX-1]|uniref:LysM peptidoglycan-binding domain-containing protein n=1 Tax=Kineococcus sp. DHX-1 TaxID=3349638 RepID=UPI0036D353FA
MTTPTTPHERARRPGDRLPRAASSRGARTAELLRGTAAGTVLLAVLAGVPWLLVTVVGNPLPTTAPHRGWLDAELSTSALLDVLAVVLWLLWLHFAVCVVAELHAWATGAPTPRPALGGPAQLLARRLVAAALLVTAGGIPLAAPALATPAPAAVGVATAAPDPGWGGGHEAGAARPTAGAPAADEAPDPAWTAPPTPGAGTGADTGLVAYVVQPPQGRHHDCLWDIAERTLGDPLRYREVFELNRDRVQADGSRLVDADLVRPGWTLLLPADAVAQSAADPGGAPQGAGRP